MKRRKGKTRTPVGRSQSIRLQIERLETRLLLAGFASVVVPGALDTGTVEPIETTSYINVKLTEPDCFAGGFASSSGSGSSCGLPATGNDTSTRRVLAVGDGLGFSLRVPSGDSNGNASSTSGTTSAANTTEPATASVANDQTPSQSSGSESGVVSNRFFATDGVVDGATQSGLDAIVEVSFTDPELLADETRSRTNEVSTNETFREDDDVTAADVGGDSEKSVGVFDAELVNAADRVQPRIASLARTQTFALLSPSDVTNKESHSLNQSATANSLTAANGPTNSQVDRVFEEIDGEELSPAEEQLTEPAFDMSAIEISELDLNFEARGNASASSLNEHSSPLIEGRTAVPLKIFEDVLRAILAEAPSLQEPTSITDAPINPGLPADESENEEVIDQVYLDGINIVEGIILIAVLPSSLICQHDKSKGRFSVSFRVE